MRLRLTVGELAMLGERCLGGATPSPLLERAVADLVAARIDGLEDQIRDLLEEREELLTEVRRLRMGNHPAGRALRSLPPIAPFAVALAEALTERDEHEGGGGA